VIGESSARLIRARDAGAAALLPYAGLGKADEAPRHAEAGGSHKASEISELRAALVQAGTELERLQAELVEEYQRGLGDGRLCALDDCELDRTEALRHVEAALVQATRAFDDKLSQIEGLAQLIAVEAVQKLVGRSDRYREILWATIDLQLTRLRETSAKLLTLSADDFDDDPAIARLRAEGFEVAVSNDLQRGQCRLSLTVGGVEIGPADQWPVLKGFIEETLACQPASVCS
jgi:flagellar biosynthesis/type III secretory pathway protein FliH